MGARLLECFTNVKRVAQSPHHNACDASSQRVDCDASPARVFLSHSQHCSRLLEREEERPIRKNVSKTHRERPSSEASHSFRGHDPPEGLREANHSFLALLHLALHHFEWQQSQCRESTQMRGSELTTRRPLQRGS